MFLTGDFLALILHIAFLTSTTVVFPLVIPVTCLHYCFEWATTNTHRAGGVPTKNSENFRIVRFDDESLPLALCCKSRHKHGDEFSPAV